MAQAESPRVQEKVYVDNYWWHGSNSISVFVSGKTGTGKSTLVNALLGEKVAKEGDTLDPETSEVESYTRKIRGIDVTVWDSPGLQDGINNEDKYLGDIKKKCNDKIDLLLYCISMSTTRFVSGSPDMVSITKLTKTLGPEIWENAVIVITQANSEIGSIEDMLDDPESVEAKFYERLEQWRSVIVQFLHKDVGLSAEVAQNMQILPAGRREIPFLFEDHMHLPWLSHLWIESLAATKTRAQPALIKMNKDRLIRNSDVREVDDIEDLLRRLKIVLPEREDFAGQANSRKIKLSFAAQILLGTLHKIIPHIQSGIYQLSDIADPALQNLLSYTEKKAGLK